MLLSFAFALLSNNVFAATFKAEEEALKLNDPLIDDHYVVGLEGAEINGDTTGDLYILSGENVVINGDVDGDLYVLGGTVEINGKVKDDLKVLGGKVTLNSEVADDVMAGGMDMKVSESAKVGGSLYIAGSDLMLEGDVAGNVHGSSSKFGLAGKVAGNVDLIVKERLAVAQNALIGGNLSYRAPVETNIPESVVKGVVTFSEMNFRKDEMKMHGGMLFAKALSFGAALLFVLLFVVFMPEMVKKTGKLMQANIWGAVGYGLLAAVILTFGAILVMITLIGVPLGLIMLATFAIGAYFSKIFVAMWISSYMVDHVKKPNRAMLFGFMTLSLAFIYLICLIPFVGMAISFILFFLGLGGLVLMKKEYMEFLRAKKML